jgi:hypothetical protein
MTRFAVSRAVLMFALVASTLAVPDSNAADAATLRPDGQHDFDFEFGSWRATVKRLRDPFAEKQEWVEYTGPSVVRPVWDGRANLGEIDLAGPAGKIRGLSMRLYDPTTHEWRIHWANSNEGLIGAAMVGGFRSGRGEFYNQEVAGGHTVFVRFIFSDITKRTFKLEQAFSSDGGRTWQPNWLASFERN